MHNDIIYYQDIVDYFNLEAEYDQKKHDELRALPLVERIHKRKAIEDIRWDSSYMERSKEGDRLYRLIIHNNLSDFTEGEKLELHNISGSLKAKCTLYQYDEEENIIIAIYRTDNPLNNAWENESLILDKDCVDLREYVYSKYTSSETSSAEGWENKLINTHQIPLFCKVDEMDLELKDTENNFQLSLNEKQREAIIRSMATDSHYLIQGPPGTGKSFVLSIIILEELLFFNHKVVVTGPNHMAINNALDQVLKLGPELAPHIGKIGPLYKASDFSIEKDGHSYQVQRFPQLDVFNWNCSNGYLLCGLMPHALYTNRARGLKFDTLVIDEAGQTSIPLALMAMKNAQKVIFAGDHKQLPPIITSDKIAPALRQSIFQRLIANENYTLLDTSYRMCEPICRFISDLFYEGKLKAHNKGKGSAILNGGDLYSFDAPIILYNVDDEGKQSSDKEAIEIERMIYTYCERMDLPPQEIGVLSPFRAQVSTIRRLLSKSSLLSDITKQEVRVDTIDKMQGQECEVIMVSMASGDWEYMQEMGEFLYNPHKLNVAFSRAKSKLIIVGNFNKIKFLDKNAYPHIAMMLESTSTIHLGF
jgi:AAA ATPase